VIAETLLLRPLVKAIPSSWLERDGRRLDCNPYMSGALEAKVLLERLSTKKVPLQDVCLDGRKGLVNAGRIKRQWVTDEKYGLRFLSSTDILKSDLSDLQLISKQAARANPKLQIRSEWTLITRAGTIGRMAYARPEMDGLACSEDVLRVIPDAEKIPPGYLYAYLSSKFGVPLVVGGTYGAIIQHIEPEHIADLPVPRLGQKLEIKAHTLVAEAAALRSHAACSLQKAIESVESTLHVPTHRGDGAEPLSQSIMSSTLRSEMRFEGYYYNSRALTVDKWALGHPNGFWSLGEVADVFDVPPFKHIYVEPAYGLPFFTSGELFLLDRHAEKYLSKTRTRDLRKYVIEQGWVLLARSGQLGGILGRPQFADSSLHQACTSDHVIRMVAKTIPAGYLYAYLATPSVGYVLLTRTMTGASIPALWPTYLKKLRVAKATPRFMGRIHEQVTEAFEDRVKATALEDEARRLVEQAIEKGATN
jgi:type I restriction enzyme S subunit